MLYIINTFCYEIGEDKNLEHLRYNGQSRAPANISQ